MHAIIGYFHKVEDVDGDGGMQGVIRLPFMQLTFVELGPVIEALFPHFAGVPNLGFDVNQHSLVRAGHNIQDRHLIRQRIFVDVGIEELDRRHPWRARIFKDAIEERD